MPRKQPNLVLKLASAFLALSLVAVGAVGYVIYARSSNILRGLVAERITATAVLKSVEVENWTRDLLRNAQSFSDLQVVRQNLAKWSQMKAAPHSTIWCAAFSPGNKLLATGGANHLCHIWDLDNSSLLCTLAHQNTVRTVLFLYRDNLLLTIDYENILRIWNLDTQRTVFSQRLVHHLSLSGPGPEQLLAISTWNKKTMVWSLQEIIASPDDVAAPLLVIDGADSWVALSAAGNLLAVADGKTSTALYHIETTNGPGKLHSRLLVKVSGGDAGLAFSPDGGWLATVRKNGDIAVYPLEPRSNEPNLEAASRLRIHAGEEREIAFSADSKWLGIRSDASASFDLLGLDESGNQNRAVWRQVVSLEEVYGFGFSPGEPALLLTALEDFAAAVWDLSKPLSEGRPLRHDFETEAEGGAGVAYSHDGLQVSVTSWTGRVQTYVVEELVSSPRPDNAAAAHMQHTPLPVVLLGDALRSQVDSRAEWEAAALYDHEGHQVAQALTQEDILAPPPNYSDRDEDQAGLLTLTSPEASRPQLLVVEDVAGEHGQKLGTLICRMGYDGLDRILREHTGVGRQGELYLASHGRLLSDSRGRLEATQSLAQGLRAHPVSEPYVNFAGKQVFGVARAIEPGDWQLVAEMPVSEALAPARDLAWIALLTGFGLVLALFGAGLYLSRRIALPFMDAAALAQRMVTGHVDPTGKALEGDEARVLSAAFARMQPALEERMRILQALDIANEVQSNLLPGAPPQIPGLDIAGRCDFCEATGGDYFDYIPTAWPQGQGLAVVVGDVTGHGVPAALLMTSLRAFLRQRLAVADGSPMAAAKAISDVNRQLAKDVGLSGRFVTLFYLDIHRPSSMIRWVRGGHDPAVVFDQQSDSFSELGGSGLALGVIEDAPFQELTRTVHPGMVLVVGTDGIWEAVGQQRQMFGKKRLEEIIRATAHKSAATILDAVFTAVHEHQQMAPKGFEHPDDLTLVVIKVLPIAKQ